MIFLEVSSITRTIHCCSGQVSCHRVPRWFLEVGESYIVSGQLLDLFEDYWRQGYQQVDRRQRGEAW